jgi:hypothetical protein
VKFFAWAFNIAIGAGSGWLWRRSYVVSIFVILCGREEDATEESLVGNLSHTFSVPALAVSRGLDSRERPTGSRRGAG